MWNKEQTELITQFCALSGLDHDSTAVILKTGTVICNDVTVTLLPGDASRLLRIYVQLGMPPDDQAIAIYRRLLELNLLLAHRNERLALDPETGMAIFTCQLAATTPAQLLASLQAAAGRALEWRSGYFLTDEDVGEPA